MREMTIMWASSYNCIIGEAGFEMQPLLKFFSLQLNLHDLCSYIWGNFFQHGTFCLLSHIFAIM